MQIKKFLRSLWFSILVLAIFSSASVSAFTGAAGAAGSKGAKGDMGDHGLNGADGAKGDMGDHGMNGHSGMKGEQGDCAMNGCPAHDNFPFPGCSTGAPHNGDFNTCALGDWRKGRGAVSMVPSLSESEGCAAALGCQSTVYQPVTGLELGRYRLSACGQPMGSQGCAIEVRTSAGVLIDAVLINPVNSEECPMLGAGRSVCGCAGSVQCSVSTGPGFVALPSDTFFIGLVTGDCGCNFDNICLSKDDCDTCGFSFRNISTSTANDEYEPASVGNNGDDSTNNGGSSSGSDHSNTASNGSNLSSGAIGGIIAGAVVGVIAVFGIAFFIGRKSAARRSQQSSFVTASPAAASAAPAPAAASAAMDAEPVTVQVGDNQL